jgi:protein TonB
MVTPAAPNLQPLATLPPAQGKISRQLPKLPAEALATMPLPMPLPTLPPEPEPVWEEVAEEAVAEPVYEEIVQEPVYEEFVPDDVIFEDSPPPMETFVQETVWEEPAAPQPRQRQVRRERPVRQAQRRQVEYYEPPRRTAGRNYEQRAAASSSYGSGDQKAAPRYDVNPRPSYPIQARRRGLQGTVTLRVLVDAGGSVADVRLAGSSGHSILDQAAMNSVRSWSFRPGTSGGRPTQMWVEVPVRFALN